MTENAAREGVATCNTSSVAELRERLVTMRQDLVGRLVARMDGGEMALLGSVGAAIAAVDAMQQEPAREESQS